MPQIIRSAQAERDTVEIWAYIARNNPSAADHLLDTFDEIFTSLSMQPHLGKSVEELAANLRFFPTGNYLIFYRPVTDGVEIVRVLHGARDITEEFFR